MAGLLAVDGHVQVDNAAVLPLGEPRHLHRCAVGDLLVQTPQHLLPHDLGAHLTVRLIGGHTVGEQLRALLRVLGQLGHQVVQPVPRPGGDGDDGVEPVIRLAVRGDDLQQCVLLFHRVDLVDAQHAGQPLLPDALDQNALRLAHMGDGLHQQQRALHVAQALPHHLHHVVAQTAAGLVQARGVQQHVLGAVPIHHAVNAVAGGLGLVRHDGDLLAHQCIGQAGLAHVGPSAHGNHGSFRYVFHQVILNFLSFEQFFVYVLLPFQSQPPMPASSRARIRAFCGPSSMWS